MESEVNGIKNLYPFKTLWYSIHWSIIAIKKKQKWQLNMFLVNLSMPSAGGKNKLLNNSCFVRNTNQIHAMTPNDLFWAKFMCTNKLIQILKLIYHQM